MEEKVLELLEEICDDHVVFEDRDINLFEEDLLDSLTFTELLVELEERFDIVISPSEIEKSQIDTPNKIIAVIKAKVEEN